MTARIPFIFLLCVGMGFFAHGQTCVPDPMYADSTGFVFPPPYDSLLNPDGGIDDPACIGKYFEFVWTIDVPTDVTVFGFPVQLDQLSLATSGAVTNLPKGVGYVCNPPNCVFKVNEPGCVLLYGTPTTENMPGIRDLGFTGSLKTKPGAVLPVSFPDPNLYPGHYYLTVLDGNDPGCLASTDPESENVPLAEWLPNPVGDRGTFKIISARPDRGSLEILDPAGRTALSWTIDLQAGENLVPLELSTLQPGLWIYRWQGSEGNVVAGKLVRADP